MTVISERATDERTELLAVLSGERHGAANGLLLRTREVALLFQVSERTVTEWAKRGRIASMRTPGGHRRYPVDEVRMLLGMGA